jgi:hypothetical protein
MLPRCQHPVLEVLDREASFFSFFSPHPEVPLLSIAIDGRLSTSAATRQELMQAKSELTKCLFDWLDAV